MINIDKFYNEHFKESCFYAYSKIGKWELAEDITQECFIKLYNSLDSIKEGKYENWLKKVIKNKCIDFYRSKKNELNLYNFNINLEENEYIYLNDNNQSYDDILSMLSPEENEDVIDKYKKLITLVDKLAPVSRKVFIMHDLEHETHDYIANKLNISPNTSKSNLTRARRNLKKLIET